MLSILKHIHAYSYYGLLVVKGPWLRDSVQLAGGQRAGSTQCYIYIHIYIYKLP